MKDDNAGKIRYVGPAGQSGAVEDEASLSAELERLQNERAALGEGGDFSSLAASVVNGVGMEFVLIRPGTFVMGDSGMGDAPPHEVRISRPFYMGKYPVTQRQWESVMGSNPSVFKGADRPVENVSWDDVQDFIERLNAREGHGRHRLPTEAEWEYACRAGSVTAYCFGDDEGQLGNYAWYRDNSGGETHPVGQKRPNAWGLHDMHGNVWEWVQDWYGEYGVGAAVDPQGPRAGDSRVLRGGSLDYVAGRCLSADRSWGYPDYCGNYSDSSGGFRLALSPGP